MLAWRNGPTARLPFIGPSARTHPRRCPTVAIRRIPSTAHHAPASRMTDPSPDLDAYRRRIGFEGPIAPTREALARLVAAHAAAIPFENVEVLAGRVPRLDLASLQGKLVARRRGGWCFEQNSLFLAVLQQAGFTARALEGRVRAGVPADVVTARTHMAIAVALDGAEYLVDVGFGSFAPHAPLALASREEQGDGFGTYRFVDVDGDLLLQCRSPEGWTDCYRLLPSRPLAIDREMGNWWVATHPRALLRHNLLVARATPRGRLTLYNDRLSLRRAGTAEPEEQAIATRAELAAVLADAFGLDLDPADVDAVQALLERRAAAAG